MSEETFDKIAILLLFVFVFAIGMAVGEYTANHDMREACQKEHNVYECELVAQPKSEERL